jgi:glycine cleavage system T protein (aminomethyltransferase)
MALKQSPLDAEHRALGAKLVDFGGWEMPLAYPDGTLAEHHACRTGAVVFDVSHLGTVRVVGPDAYASLQRALTNDLAKIGEGRAQYTHLLDSEDASVLDDIIVWWAGPERFDVMPNASNTDRVVEALAGCAQGEIDANDVTATRAVLAVQGPGARSAVRSVFPAAADVPRFRVASLDWKDAACTVAGTGYTGEDGIEIAVAADQAGELWRALLDAGLAPGGLGARDTLRLEAGLPLHGHELGPGITPLQAGLGWVVAWDKGEFLGRAPLLREKERGIARRLRGLSVEGRRPPRADQAVLLGDDVVGTVTSGNFSPTLEHGVALAFVPPTLPESTRLQIDARGHRLDATIVPLPFYTSS